MLLNNIEILQVKKGQYESPFIERIGLDDTSRLLCGSNNDDNVVDSNEDGSEEGGQFDDDGNPMNSVNYSNWRVFNQDSPRW